MPDACFYQTQRLALRPPCRDDGTLLGSTGLAFETAHRASTGFVLARDAWGAGMATEALAAMVSIAPAHGVS
jgi:RimJ/RimL family protein N-acetyltransferase